MDEATAAKALEGAETIFHCVMPRYDKWTTEFGPLNTSILNGGARAGASLVWGDNMYAYGRVDGPRTEQTPTRAHTRKGIVRARLAEQLMEANEAGRVRTTIGRMMSRT